MKKSKKLFVIAIANDHSLKVEDIIWKILEGSSVFTFLSVCLFTLCTPQFWSHNIVNPYLGSIYVQLDATKIYI